jgi:hypothetical protein
VAPRDGTGNHFGGALLARSRRATLTLAGRGGRLAACTGGRSTSSREVRAGRSLRRRIRPLERLIRPRATTEVRGHLRGTAATGPGSFPSGACGSVARPPQCHRDRRKSDPGKSEVRDYLGHKLAQLPRRACRCPRFTIRQDREASYRNSLRGVRIGRVQPSSYCYDSVHRLVRRPFFCTPSTFTLRLRIVPLAGAATKFDRASSR